MDKNFWLVSHPTFRFNEDVKALARKNGLVVIDEAMAGEFERERQAEDVPRLTLRDEFKPKRKTKAGEGEGGDAQQA